MGKKKKTIYHTSNGPLQNFHHKITTKTCKYKKHTNTLMAVFKL